MQNMDGLDRKRVLQLASAHQIVPNVPSEVVRSIGQFKRANNELCAIKKNMALRTGCRLLKSLSEVVRQLVRLSFSQ